MKYLHFNVSHTIKLVFFYLLSIIFTLPIQISNISEPGLILPPGEYLATSGDIFVDHNWGDGISWVGARIVATAYHTQ